MTSLTADFPPALPGELGRRVDRAMYLAQQASLVAVLGPLVRMAQQLVPGTRAEPPSGAIATIQRRYRELLDEDLANVRNGVYPRQLLFQIPIRDYAKALPETFGDVPRVLRRVRRRAHDELPRDVDLSAYPAYYRRTFHWQTDGWFSAKSARIYDVGVEILFGGTADVMRRQALPPLVAALGEKRRPRLLDIACGTGRFLSQAHKALPNARLYGLDLSPYYVAHARKVLRHVPDASFVAENAEAMPFADATFDAASSVFLFHELPKDARRNVAREAFRVLAPGGRFVVCDSCQLSDSPEITHYLRQFAAQYHEPYYKGYLDDDLATMLAEVGFVRTRTSTHFLSKVVVAEKPG